MKIHLLLTDLAAAGVTTIALDPNAGKIRWSSHTPLSSQLRNAVVAHKAALLALVDVPLMVAPHELARRYSPAPTKRGGYSSDEANAWLFANGWRRDRDGWIASDGSTIAQPLPAHVVTFGHDMFLAAEGKPAWYITLTDGQHGFFPSDTDAQRWAEGVMR